MKIYSFEVPHGILFLKLLERSFLPFNNLGKRKILYFSLSFVIKPDDSIGQYYIINFFKLFLEK
jgi:hypothetical protein